MATQLDLEEQEQLDQLKAFWNQHGNLITVALFIVAAAYLAWIGWNAWQRDQGAKAGAMFDELDRAVQAADADRTGRIFADMKERYPHTTFTGQAGLLAARVAADKGQAVPARADLAWVAENASEDGYRAIAHLRLAGLLLDDKKYDEALKQVDAVEGDSYAALAADRRGDILMAQGKTDDGKAAYRKAWAALDPKIDYRRVVEAKLDALGAPPAASGVEASK
jgi:predicted negative regulator of RcsB-dependent stress response